MSEEPNTSMTPINFAMGFYMNLNNRIIEKDDYYLADNIFGYYKGLDRIYILIIFKVDENKKDLEFLENKFEEARTKLEEKKPKKEIMTLLRVIDKKLMRTMHKHHMIFPNFNQTFGMKKIIDKYKLPGYSNVKH